MPLSGLERHDEFEPDAGPAFDERLRRRTGRPARPVGPRLEAWRAVGRASAEVSLVRRRAVKGGRTRPAGRGPAWCMPGARTPSCSVEEAVNSPVQQARERPKISPTFETRSEWGRCWPRRPARTLQRPGSCAVRAGKGRGARRLRPQPHPRRPGRRAVLGARRRRAAPAGRGRPSRTSPRAIGRPPGKDPSNRPPGPGTRPSGRGPSTASWKGSLGLRSACGSGPRPMGLPRATRWSYRFVPPGTRPLTSCSLEPVFLC